MFANSQVINFLLFFSEKKSEKKKNLLKKVAKKIILDLLQLGWCGILQTFGVSASHDSQIASSCCCCRSWCIAVSWTGARNLGKVTLKLAAFELKVAKPVFLNNNGWKVLHVLTGWEIRLCPSMIKTCLRGKAKQTQPPCAQRLLCKEAAAVAR